MAPVSPSRSLALPRRRVATLSSYDLSTVLPTFDALQLYLIAISRYCISLSLATVSRSRYPTHLEHMPTPVRSLSSPLPRHTALDSHRHPPCRSSAAPASASPPPPSLQRSRRLASPLRPTCWPWRQQQAAAGRNPRGHSGSQFPGWSPRRCSRGRRLAWPRAAA